MLTWVCRDNILLDQILEILEKMGVRTHHIQITAWMNIDALQHKTTARRSGSNTCSTDSDSMDSHTSPRSTMARQSRHFRKTTQVHQVHQVQSLHLPLVSKLALLAVPGSKGPCLPSNPSSPPVITSPPFQGLTSCGPSSATTCP